MAALTQSQDHSGEGYGFAPRLVLASLAVAAGGVHLAMAPLHASSSAIEAASFAAAGWLQILVAFAILVRPGRFVFTAAIVVHVAIIAGYIVSRTVGLPVGDHAGQAESVGGIDLMVTIFQAVLIAGAAVLLIWPRLGATEGSSANVSFETLIGASAVPLVVLVVTSVALADPSLTPGGHGEGALVASAGGGGDGHGAASDPSQLVSLAQNRCDLGINPAAYWREASMAGVDTITGGESSPLDHNASAQVQGSAELDKLISLHTTVQGEVGDAQVVLALARVSDDVYDNWLRWMGASGIAGQSHGATTDPATAPKTMGGSLGPQSWHAMTDQKQCDQLTAELDLARETALRYPTVADAKAAGWRQVAPYVPGIAAHFMNFGLVDGTFDIEKPEMILYDGTGDDARVIGLSYYLLQEGPAQPTQGFTGNNDEFHRHIGLCVDDSGVIGDSATTQEDCAEMGGRKADGGDAWMNHVWIVPGCESPWGMFSAASPLLDGDLPKASGTDGGGCAGSGVRDRYDLAPGVIENTPTEVGGAMDLASSGN